MGRSDTVSLYTVRECWLLAEPQPVASEGVTAVTWADPGSVPDRTLPQVRRLVRDGVPAGGSSGSAPRERTGTPASNGRVREQSASNNSVRLRRNGR